MPVLWLSFLASIICFFFPPAVINHALSTKTTKGHAMQEQQQSDAEGVIAMHIGTDLRQNLV